MKIGELENNVIRFRATEASDLPMIYYLAHVNPWSFRWAFRDVVPQFDRFQQTVWYRSICRFVVETRESCSPIGLAVGWTDSGMRDSVKLDIVYSDEERYRRFWRPAADVITRYISSVLDVHKIIFEVPACLFAELELSTITGISVEGRMSEYFRLGGRYEDMLILRYDPKRHGDRDSRPLGQGSAS